MANADVTRVTVERHAADFRRAIEAVLPHLGSIGLRHFPWGSCWDASLLLGESLYETGCGDWVLHTGWFDDASHTWIGHDDLLVDITADQFGDGSSGVICTTRSEWHERLTTRTVVGQARLGAWSGSDPTDADLRADFRTLRTYLQTSDDPSA